MQRMYSGYAVATNTASATVPMIGLGSATTIRPAIYDFTVGSAATPASNATQYVWQRSSTLGTTSATFTPVAIDPADPASLATVPTAWSGNPTLTASAYTYSFAVNMQATYRWVAYPGSEMKVANSTTGLYLMSLVTTAAYSTTFSFLYYE